MDVFATLAGFLAAALEVLLGLRPSALERRDFRVLRVTPRDRGPALLERIPALRLRNRRLVRQPLCLVDQRRELGVSIRPDLPLAVARLGVAARDVEAPAERGGPSRRHRRESVPRRPRVGDPTRHVGAVERLDALAEGRARREAFLDRLSSMVHLGAVLRRARGLGEDRFDGRAKPLRDGGMWLDVAGERVPSRCARAPLGGHEVARGPERVRHDREPMTGSHLKARAGDSAASDGRSARARCRTALMPCGGRRSRAARPHP